MLSLSIRPTPVKGPPLEVLILGTHGIPARHGGFETFAENLSLYLVNRGHRVTVYCPASGGHGRSTDEWNGVRRVLIPAPDRAMGTVKFDWATVMHSSRTTGVVLTLGYNTAVFSLLYRLRHVRSVMNMDGIEWKRDKWRLPQKAWLHFNELAGARLAHHLVADHPEIAKHLQRHTPARKITVIPYGSAPITSARREMLDRYSLKPKAYYLLIARPEPENSILEVVRAFSASDINANAQLAILGKYSPETNPYHRLVQRAAGPNVRFLGALYDRTLVRSLRFFAKAYIHGHRVGGTNPSLVEALAAGNAVISHDNRFNRWVAGKGALYFRGVDDLVDILSSLERNPNRLLKMESDSRVRHQEEFMQERVLSAYERLLTNVANDHAMEDDAFQEAAFPVWKS